MSELGRNGSCGSRRAAAQLIGAMHAIAVHNIAYRCGRLDWA